MKLYHCLDARSFRALWTLEELGLAYELVVLPFPPRALAKSFLDLNPLGTIPLLIDGDTKLTESAAICQYLATRDGPTPLAVSPGEAGYGAWLNGLHQGEATLTFPQTLVLRYGRFEPDERRQPQVVDDYAAWFAARLRWIDALLERDDHIAAGRFTAADISTGYALMLGETTGLADRYPPRVAAYWQRLRARDGFHRAKTAQDRAAREQSLEVGA